MEVQTLEELKPGTLPVIMARFQIDALHCEHIRLIKECMKINHGQILIVLGINLVGSTRRNPLDYFSRMMMIREHFPDPRVAIVGLKDRPRDNEGWSQALDDIVSDHLLINQEAVMCGGRDSFLQSYRGRHHKWEMESRDPISASQIRRGITGPVQQSYTTYSSTRNYRRGVIAQFNNSYNLHPTAVDTVIWEKERNNILLCRKPGQDEWRFVGGFCDGITPYEQDGIREAKEETNVEVGKTHILSTHVMDDYRYLHEEENIISILQVGEYKSGFHDARDDIEDCMWFPVTYFDWPEGEAPYGEKYNLDMIRPLHRSMMEEALDWINKQEKGKQ